AREIFGDQEGVKEIDLLTLDVEDTTREILECKNILSTSLHGLIIAHAYEIPAIWVNMSDKIFDNDIKYSDNLDSVRLDVYEPPLIESKIQKNEIVSMFESYPVIASSDTLQELKAGLLGAKPF